MDNTTNTLAEQSKLRRLVNSYGVPRLIITGFLLLMFILAPVAGVDFATQITNVINRFSWNAIMVLAMVPMIHSGCGLNFGLPLGIISGLLGATLSIEFGFTGGMSFLMAIVIATPFALVLGGGYGWMLNKIKGGEMMVATYVGFSSVSFMCMMWLLLPYKSPTMVWGFAGKGLRTTISLEGFYDQFLAKFLQIDLNRYWHQSGDPHRQPAVLRSAGIPDVGLPAHQDRYRYDGCGLKPHLCQGCRYQRGQDPSAVRGAFHLAGCCGHPAV